MPIMVSKRRRMCQRDRCSGAADHALKFHLRPEACDESASSNTAHIEIVLDDWLDQERSINHQDVELEAVLNLPGRHPGREELRAEAISHIAQRHGVVEFERQRLVVSQSCRELGVVAIDVWRTPVERKRCVQTLCSFRVDAPERLARLPVQEIVAGHGRRIRRGREISRIVGSSERVEAGISLPGLEVVEGSHRRCCLAWGEANLRNYDRMSMELRDKACWVARERRRIAGHYHRFQKKRLHWYDANLCRWSREWIKGLERRRQIAQRIVHWLVDE